MKNFIFITTKRIILLVSLFSLNFVSCELDNTITEDEYEPNDSEEKAKLISTWDEVFGYIDEDDVNFYQYNATRNYLDFTQIIIDNQDNYNEIETRIFNEQMDEILKVIGRQREKMNIKFPNSGGTYFLKLKSYNDRTGDYNLTITELHANDHYEPDNTIEQGRVIDTYPTDDLFGTLLTDDDFAQVDYECFKVRVGASKRVKYDIIPASSQIALTLYVYNKDLNLIETVSKAKGESITNKYLYNADTAQVELYLKLYGDVPDNGGDYRISFSESVYQRKNRSGNGVNQIN